MTAQKLPALVIEPEGIGQDQLHLSHLFFCCPVVIVSPGLKGCLLMDHGDQFRLTGHRLWQNGIGPAHAVRLMGVASPYLDLVIFFRQLQRMLVGLLRLSAVECLHKVKPLHQLRRSAVALGVGKA